MELPAQARLDGRQSRAHGTDRCVLDGHEDQVADAGRDPRAEPRAGGAFAVDRRDFGEPECPNRLERGLRVVAHLPRNDQNDELHAGDPGSRTPSQRRIPIIGQVLVKADWQQVGIRRRR